MSRDLCWERVFGPVVEASVEDVREVAFEGSSGFAGCFAFRDFSSEISLGVGVVALLDDGDAVEGGVELSVAAAVEAVASAGLA
jgi:hypothetical protein